MLIPQVIKDRMMRALDELPRPKLAGKVRIEFELNYNTAGIIGSVKQIKPIEQELR